MYLLDTNVCIHLMNGDHPQLTEKLREKSPTEIRLCSIVKAELLFGARNSQRIEANLQLLQRFFDSFASLPFDDRSISHYGVIRTELKSMGKLIGPNDLLIAAIACSFNATLVTHNTKEFSRVTGLRLEDWELVN